MTTLNQTEIHVFNAITKPTSDQILVFLQPVEVSTDFLFSAWNVLNPRQSSSQTVDLSRTFSASIAEWGSSHRDYADPVPLPLGRSLTITDLNNQAVVITNIVHESLDPDQVGLYNDATTPPTDVSVLWYVSGRRVVETNNTAASTLTPGFSSTFEFRPSVFLMFGQRPTVTTTYTARTLSETVDFPIPNGAGDLYVKAYTNSVGINTFMEVSAEQFAELQRESVATHAMPA